MTEREHLSKAVYKHTVQEQDGQAEVGLESVSQKLQVK